MYQGWSFRVRTKTPSSFRQRVASHSYRHANLLQVADGFEVEDREKNRPIEWATETDSNDDADHHDLKDLITGSG